MNRNMDLMRTLLFKIADDPQYNGRGSKLLYPADYVTDKVDYYEIDYNLTQLIDAGLLDAKQLQSPEFAITMVTSAGHDFLDDTCDPNIWNKAKQNAKAVGGASLSIVWQIAVAELKAKLGVP